MGILQQRHYFILKLLWALAGLIMATIALIQFPNAREQEHRWIKSQLDTALTFVTVYQDRYKQVPPTKVYYSWLMEKSDGLLTDQEAELIHDDMHTFPKYYSGKQALAPFLSQDQFRQLDEENDFVLIQYIPNREEMLTYNALTREYTGYQHTWWSLVSTVLIYLFLGLLPLLWQFIRR